jgi:hypothetical protein
VGAALRILSHNASAANVYVQRCEVNGRAVPADAMMVEHADLVGRPDGRPSLLEFWMTAEPPAARGGGGDGSQSDE